VNATVWSLNAGRLIGERQTMKMKPSLVLVLFLIGALLAYPHLNDNFGTRESRYELRPEPGRVYTPLPSDSRMKREESESLLRANLHQIYVSPLSAWRPDESREFDVVITQEIGDIVEEYRFRVTVRAASPYRYRLESRRPSKSLGGDETPDTLLQIRNAIQFILNDAKRKQGSIQSGVDRSEPTISVEPL
jgi:hypothetical protein